MTRSPRRLKQQVRDTVGEQVRDLPLHAVRLAMFGVGRALLLSDRVTRDYKEITEGGGVRPVIGRLRTDVQNTAGRLAGRVVERVRGEEPEPGPETDEHRTAPRHAGGHKDGEISIGKPAEAGHAPKHARPEPGPAKPVAKPAPKPEVDRPGPESAAQAKPAPRPTPDPSPKPAPKPEPKGNAADADGQKAGNVADRVADKAAFDPKPEVKPAAQAEAEQAAKDLPVPDYDAATLPQLRARLRGLSADQVKLLREYERKHASRPEVIKMYENRIAKLNGLN
ncbi:hypothetical protein AGRA3207_005779 [Actinomadura graeca]|uniref:DUF8129 domain-containing protein n=1 Tax=Actinomadura graeca TaxID=2750812 RepID=A0ABX8R068_9ACTN|nr:hypothetical protein [Actinomadura graeca]QXJ24450.1 hypothetical protein AGRA3207_005779 [Actinomadura graeca]